MISRREVFRRLAVAFGAAFIPEVSIDRALAFVKGSPRGESITYLRIESLAQNKGRVYVGLPGMNVRSSEGVFFWIEPGNAVHAEFDPKDNVCLGDIWVESSFPGDRIDIKHRTSGGESSITSNIKKRLRKRG